MSDPNLPLVPGTLALTHRLEDVFRSEEARINLEVIPEVPHQSFMPAVHFYGGNHVIPTPGGNAQGGNEEWSCYVYGTYLKQAGQLEEEIGHVSAGSGCLPDVNAYWEQNGRLAAKISKGVVFAWADCPFKMGDFWPSNVERLMGRWVEHDASPNSFTRHHHVEPFGLTDESHLKKVRDLVLQTVGLSSSEPHMIYRQQIATLEEKVASLHQAFSEQVVVLTRALDKANACVETLVRTVTGKLNRQLLLHEAFVGLTSEISDEDVTVKYNREGDLRGEDIVQYYRNEQFNVKPPTGEGASIEAYVFMVEVPDVAAAPAEAELPDDNADRFAGFGSAPLSGDVEM